jgi:predicted Fe-Mo cluster-binding NifX family protein
VKIAITSEGQTLDSAVDPRFGRAAYFVLVDTDAGTSGTRDNAQNVNGVQGAGIQAAEAVSRLGAGVVLTRQSGPRAFRTLACAGVQATVGVGGTAREALEAFQAGRLKPRSGPDVGCYRV